MFRATLLIVVAACAAIVRNAEPAGATPTQDPEITNAGGGGWQMTWRVPLDTLKRASKWNSESEPQLPVRQAVVKAREYLRSQGRPNQLPVTSVELRHVNGTPSQCFAYVLEFGERFEPEKGSLVVVLLDGSVVTPVTTHPGPVKAAELSPFDEPVVDFMKHAQAVYVFAPRSEAAKHPEEKDLRLLGTEAQQALLAVLTNQANWHHGLMTVGMLPYTKGSVGFLFRSNKDELTLFFCSDTMAGGCTVEGTFRGKDIFGMLNECAQPLIENWKQRYAAGEAGK
jgi:hypothetical protein